MEEKKHLNEKNYQKGKKGLTIVGITIIIIGLLIGGFLIYNGINTINQKNEESKNNNNQNEQKIELLNTEMLLIEEEIDELDSQISKAQREKQQIFSEDMGFSDRYYQKEEEIENLQDQRSDKNKKLLQIKTEIWELETDISKNNEPFNISKGMFSIIPGAFVIIFCLIIGGSILATAHQRNILAWQVQSVLPVAGEALESVTPTIKKVGEELSPLYGTMAKEIAKGIKDGIKEDK